MGFYIQDDMWEAVSELPRKTQDEVIGSLARLFFEGEQTPLKGVSRSLFVAFRDRVILSTKRSECGKQNGKQKAKQTAKQSAGGTESKGASESGAKSEPSIKEGEGDKETWRVRAPLPRRGQGMGCRRGLAHRRRAVRRVLRLERLEGREEPDEGLALRRRGLVPTRRAQAPRRGEAQGPCDLPEVRCADVQEHAERPLGLPEVLRVVRQGGGRVSRQAAAIILALLCAAAALRLSAR